VERPWTSSRPRARVLPAPILEARDQARELVLAAESRASELIAEAEHAAGEIRNAAREAGRDEGLLYAQRLLVEIQQARIRMLEGEVLRRSVSELEKKLIAEALDRYRGNKARVARELGLSYPTLLSRIRSYGLASGLESR